MRLTIQAGDVEIDLEGAAIQIDEQLTHVKAEHTWTVLLERIREARETAMEAAVVAAREAGLPERVLRSVPFLRTVPCRKTRPSARCHPLPQGR